MLNMDVTCGRSGGWPVCWESSTGLPVLCRAGLCDASLDEYMAEAGIGGAGSSPAGVGGIEPPGVVSGVEPLSLFSSSSRMAPRTLRTMLPTVSSRGAASTNFLPTSWTRVMSLPGSLARVVETTFRSSHAVARAHSFGPRICRRRRRDIKYSIDFSTGPEGSKARKDARPGGGGRSEAITTDWLRGGHRMSQGFLLLQWYGRCVRQRKCGRYCLDIAGGRPVCFMSNATVLLVCSPGNKFVTCGTLKFHPPQQQQHVLGSRNCSTRLRCLHFGPMHDKHDPICPTSPAS